MKEVPDVLHDFLLDGKPVQIDFEGGQLSSEAGVLLLKRVDERLHLTERLAACLTDGREPGKTQHSLLDLFRTRIFLIAQSHEDCNDANALRHEPLFKMALGRSPQDELGLPSQSTLSRFENGKVLEDRQLRKRDLLAMGFVFVDGFIERLKASPRPPTLITIDLDGTEDPTHGNQQLTFYNGHYETHCYLPMIMTASVDEAKSQDFLGAVLRPGNASAAGGTLTLAKHLVKRLRRAFPGVAIRFRLDAGFAVPEIYTWCERQEVTYEIGFPGNSKVLALADPWMKAVWADYNQQRRAQSNEEKVLPLKVQQFAEFQYKAGTWSKERRIVLKAEVSEQGENPRFVVTNRAEAPVVISESYDGRGDMENRIKEFKLDLEAGRTSCEIFLANQFRLLLHGAGYLLFQALQRLLQEEATPLSQAQVGTIRVKLLKVAALVRESARRVWIRLSSHFPLQDLFTKLFRRLQSEAVF